MKQIRKRLTYANVMSSIAVFLVIGGATAFAALGKNTVGTKQLKSNAVTAAKIKKEAVTGAKIKNGAVGTSKLGSSAVAASNIAKDAVTNEKLADNSVTGAKVADGSLTGSDINQGSLNAVKAANVYAVEFDLSAEEVVRPSDPGIKSGGCFLACWVEFPVNLKNCSATGAGVDATGSGTAIPGIIEVIHATDPKEIEVTMWNDEGKLIGHDFSLTVVCPTTS